jgi:quinol monooxygenase YgiN
MTLAWHVLPGEVASITSALQTLMMRTRAEPGCSGCSLSAEMGAQVELRYVARWLTEDDLKRQIRSSGFAQLAELLEHATDPPTVEFVVPDGTHGLEYAERIRQVNGAR